MPSWQKPTDEQIDAALQRMRSPDFEAYFFARLENPEWVEPLALRGLFAKPPAPIITDDERTMFLAWPATKYLVRMAEEAPEAVADTLDGMDVTNPNVAGDVVDAALLMPPEIARRLVPTVARAAQGGSLDFRIGEAAKLCVQFVRGGEGDAAVSLAEGLFLPTSLDESGELRRRDSYWYRQALDAVLPELTRSLPVEMLHATCQMADHRD